MEKNGDELSIVLNIFLKRKIPYGNDIDANTVEF